MMAQGFIARPGPSVPMLRAMLRVDSVQCRLYHILCLVRSHDTRRSDGQLLGLPFEHAPGQVRGLDTLPAKEGRGVGASRAGEAYAYPLPAGVQLAPAQG